MPKESRPARYHKKIKRQKLEQFVKNNRPVCLKNSESNSSSSESADSDNIAIPTVEYNTEVAEIADIKEWIVRNKIAQSHVDELLGILQRRLLPSLPKRCITLLESNIKFDIKSMAAANGTYGEYFYFGVKSNLLSTIKLELHETNILELIVNIDGFSPFKSSSQTIWPILCKIYTKQDFYKPFSACVYSGSAKFKSQVDFLKDFVNEINVLQEEGLIINNKLFEVRIKFFVCDTPARSLIKSTVGHMAFAGCERCEVMGQKVDKTTVFLPTNAAKRSNQSFRSFAQPDHHTAASISCNINPPIDMIHQFSLDPMHLLYLGCTKRLLDYLLNPSSHKVRLSEVMKRELARRTKLINKDIPVEFPRKMRCSDDFGKYEAVELKFFLLYAASVIFKKLLSNEVYNHLMLLVVSCRLLSEEDPLPHVPAVRQYLKTFVEQAIIIYGPTFISMNVHNLIHICDDIETLKCNLNSLSAFSFESYLGEISSVLRSPTNVVAQYGRRVREIETYNVAVPSVQANVQILKKKKNQITKLKYNNFVLNTCHPNNTVLLQNGKIGEIHEFCTIGSEIIYIKFKQYQKKELVFKYPQESSSVNIWEASRLATEVAIVPLDNVLKKCVKFQLNFSAQEGVRFFIVSLLH